MEENFNDFPQSLKVNNMAPLDAKQAFSTKEEMQDLGIDSYKAFTYYKGMIATIIADGNLYIWTDEFTEESEKILEEDFIYPPDTVFLGYNYSEKKFNFILFKGQPGKDGRDGQDGQDGGSGEDGQTMYIWVKYSNYPNGRTPGGIASISDNIIINGSPAEYEGLSYNRPTSVESTNPDDYTWRKIRGVDGNDGEDGEDGQSVYKVDLSNESIVIPTDADGNLYPTSLEDAKTNIKVFKGGQLLPTQDYDIELIPTNVTISNRIDLSGTITGFSVTSIFDDNGSVLVNANLKETGEYIGSDTFNISKAKGVASYELKVSSDYLHINSQGIYTTGVITAEVYKNTGIVNEPTNEGRIVYWTRKSNNSTPHVTFPASGLDTSTLPNDIDALYVAFIYPESTIIGDQEELVVVRDGANGVGRSFIALDNQNIVLSASYNGTVSNYNYATTTYQVYVNGVEYNESNLSIETSSSTLGLVFTHNQSNKTIAITNMTPLVNEAKVNLVAKINGEVIATAEIIVTKIKGGQDGENGIVYALRPERSVIKVDRLGNISPTTLKIDVVKIDGNDVTINPGDGVIIQYKVGLTAPWADLAQGGSIPQAYIASAVSGLRPYIQVRLIDSNSNVLDIEDIDISRDGTQGEQGLTGRIPRVMQWIPEQVYYNNGEFIDYIYFYSSDESHAGFYNVKREIVSAIAPATPVGSSRFVKTEYTATQVFGTFIAEGSHVGGFTTANNEFYTTIKTEVRNPVTNEVNRYNNLRMNGVKGDFNFVNRLIIDGKDGITFNDNANRARIRLGWDEESGTPFLRFLKADGTIQWEAGQDYVFWLTIDNTPIYSSSVRIINLTNESVLKDINPTATTLNTTQKDALRVIILAEVHSLSNRRATYPSGNKRLFEMNTENPLNKYNPWLTSVYYKSYNSPESTLQKGYVSNNTGSAPFLNGWYLMNGFGFSFTWLDWKDIMEDENGFVPIEPTDTEVMGDTSSNFLVTLVYFTNGIITNGIKVNFNNSNIL